jgi:hypothetical protein
MPSFNRTAAAVAAAVVAASVTAGGGALANASAQPAQRTFHVPTSIDATGHQDVTAALQHFIDLVPNYSRIAFPAGGRYRVEGTLEVPRRFGLLFAGNGSLVFATTPGDTRRSQIRISGGSGVTLQNLRIRGANPDAGQADDAFVAGKNAQHGVDVEGSDNLVLDHLTITDTYGDFVYVGKNGKGHWSDGVLIENSTFTRNGRQGVSITAGRNVSIINNSISQTRMATIDLEPNGPGWGVDRVLIAGNHIGPGRLLFIAGQGSGPETNVTVRDNVLSGHAMNIDIFDRPGDRSGFTVTGNTSDTPFASPSGAAIIFHGVDSIDVTGNRQPLKKDRNMVGVGTTTSCDVDVSGNDFPGGVGELRTDGADCSTQPTPTPTS